MIVYSEKIFQKTFSNEVSKDAYLEACKWLAKTVYSKGDLPRYITVRINKSDKKVKNKFVFIVEVFATIEEEEIHENFCHKCKQLHTIFYSIDKPECCKCNMFVYRQKVADSIKVMKGYLESELINE